MRIRALSVGLVAALVALGACSLRQDAAPTCSADHIAELVLVAQSVPTAERIPCIASTPAGWEVSGVRVRSGLTSFTFDSDRGGPGALTVTLRRTCDVTGATPVATDEPGTARYERILSVDGGIRGVRTYRFPGGCVTYQFRFSQRGQALVNEASLAVSFVTRSQVDRRVRAHSGGDLHL